MSLAMAGSAVLNVECVALRSAVGARRSSWLCVGSGSALLNREEQSPPARACKGAGCRTLLLTCMQAGKRVCLIYLP